MKKNVVYIGLLVLGIGLGYLFFGGADTHKHDAATKQSLNGRWTCSMHPQIDGKEGATCPLCAMDLVLMETGEQMLSANQFSMSESALALANVRTITVGDAGKNQGVAVQLSGTITTNAETDAVQTTLFEGRLDALYPNYVGKRVYKGQEIGKIYSPELYLAQDKLLTSVSYKDSHPKLYEAARYSLGLWKITDAQIEEMLKSGKPMMNFPLYADVSGTVTEVLGLEGNYYDEGTPIFKVSNLNTVWATFDVPEEQISLLKVKQELQLSVPALANEKIKGKVFLIEPVLNKTKRTATVRVILNNRDRKLKPGMFATATISANADTASLQIPRSAVLWTGKRSIVYIKPHKTQPVFELAEVELGASMGDTVTVLSGLMPGDEVVVSGAFTIDAAAQLQGKPAMMHRGSKDHLNHASVGLKDKQEHQPLHIMAKNSLTPLLEAYFELKDALVGTNFEAARRAAKSLHAVFDNVDGKDDLTPIKEPLALLVKATDIAQLRKHFKPFSAALIAGLKQEKGYQNTLYVQFCPMADDNKGGSWISLQEDIKNPYFGNQMLRCGLVKEQIR